MPTRVARVARSAQLAVVLTLVLAALACSLGAPAIPTTAAETPTTRPPTATTPPHTEAVEPTVAGPDASPAPADSTPSAVVGFDWDDRAPFAAGLTTEEQAALTALPGASVYHLTLTIDPGLTRVSGHQAVRYTNQEDIVLREIVFRLYPNLLGGQVTVSDVTAGGQPVSEDYYQQDTALLIGLPAPLDTGDSVVVELDFDVTVPAELERNYGVLAAAEGVLALAHFYPFIAVYDDEGWNDELAPQQGDVIYGDASFFIVQVQAPDSLVLAGGGTVIADERANGRQTVTYALGPARDFYLAASEAYVVTTGASGTTAIRVYAPEAYSAAAQQTVEDAAAALEVFAARYGPYPYTELDLVTTPTYALGIEYPGIIALTNGMLDPETHDALLLEVVTAHEVGHQWFYNLVGNDQLDDPWLDESLTQFVTWQYFADTGGPAAAEAFRDSLTGRWERIGMAEIPIGLPVADYEGREYSGIVYGRGPLFFEALAERMGRPAFDTFLADYARTYRWGIATPEAMRALAEATCGCELDELFDEWGAE